MRLRNLIRGGAILPFATATVATPATLRPVGDACPSTVATVASVAVAEGEPAQWLERLCAGDLPGLTPKRRTVAADALASLMQTGAIVRALGLGWNALELVGVQKCQPHDSPFCAGLIFSMSPGDSVTDVRRAGCIIAYSTVRHIWKRRPLPGDGSICLPWELR